MQRFYREGQIWVMLWNSGRNWWVTTRERPANLKAAWTLDLLLSTTGLPAPYSPPVLLAWVRGAAATATPPQWCGRENAVIFRPNHLLEARGTSWSSSHLLGCAQVTLWDGSRIICISLTTDIWPYRPQKWSQWEYYNGGRGESQFSTDRDPIIKGVSICSYTL